MPLQIISNDEELIINSANQFRLLKNNKEMVNSFPGVKISNKFSDNMIQTVEDLQEKWKSRGINFFGPEYTTLEKDATGKVIEKIEKSYVGPEAIQAVDQWLEKNPSVKIDIKFIDFPLNAFSGTTYEKGRPYTRISVGNGILDWTTISHYSNWMEDRTLDPLSVLDHELTHSEVNLAYIEDVKDKIDLIQKEFDRYKNEMLGNDRGVSYYLNELKKEKEKQEELIQTGVITEKSRMYKYCIENINSINKEIEEIAKLQKEGKYEEIEQKYSFRIAATIEINAQTKTKNLKEKIVEEIKAMPKEEQPILIQINDMAIDRQTRLKNSDNYQKFIRDLKGAFWLPGNLKIAKMAEEDFFNLGESLELLSRKYPELYGSLNYRFKKIFDEETGFPAKYSFADYGRGIGDLLAHDYNEVLTTFIEEGPEEWLNKIENGNEMQKKTYKELTQLSFDLGLSKMTPENYQHVLGITCSTPDCIEYRCIKYKASCCKKFQHSPNCLTGYWG
ncbi:MAG: hypothetical protein QXP53_02645 [Candidatus Pacearchaeota archaeon]